MTLLGLRMRAAMQTGTAPEVILARAPVAPAASAAYLKSA